MDNAEFEQVKTLYGAEIEREGEMGEMGGRLRWKRRPITTGVGRVGAGPMGSDYTDGEFELAATHPTGNGDKSWFWVGRVGDAYENTFRKPAPDEATAKQQAAEWVKARLKEQPDPPATPPLQAG